MTRRILTTPRQIPELLEKTLIICLAHDHAKAYRFHAKEIEELEPIQTEDTEYHYTDKEGMTFINRGAAGTNVAGKATIPMNIEHNKEHYERVFLNYFVKKLAEMFYKGRYDRIVIFVPRDMKNLTKEKMEQHLLERTEFIEGNFVKHDPMELAQKIFEEKNYLFPVQQHFLKIHYEVR